VLLIKKTLTMFGKRSAPKEGTVRLIPNMFRAFICVNIVAQNLSKVKG